MNSSPVRGPSIIEAVHSSNGSGYRLSIRDSDTLSYSCEGITIGLLVATYKLNRIFEL